MGFLAMRESVTAEREREMQEESLEEVADIRTLLECNLSLKYLGCTFSDPFPRG